MSETASKWVESEYWVKRNELVDRVKEKTPRSGADPDWVWKRYSEALNELKAFDAANGGSPVL